MLPKRLLSPSNALLQRNKMLKIDRHTSIQLKKLAAKTLSRIIYEDNTLRTIPANPINNEANPLRNDEQLK